MTLKFNQIPNPANLEALVKESAGRVYLHLSSHKPFDLTEFDLDLNRLFTQYAMQKKSLVLEICENSDYFRFVDYMTTAAYSN